MVPAAWVYHYSCTWKDTFGSKRLEAVYWAYWAYWALVATISLGLTFCALVSLTLAVAATILLVSNIWFLELRATQAIRAASAGQPPPMPPGAIGQPRSEQSR